MQLTDEIYSKIRELANKYADELRKKNSARTQEMKSDDDSHFLIYKVLGIANERFPENV